MSDAAARALAGDLTGPMPTREDLERHYFDDLHARLEQRRDAADAKARRDADRLAVLRAGLDDVHALQHHDRTGPVATMTFLHWLRTGQKSLEVPGLEQKASLVLDALGQLLVPIDITVDILNVARRGVFRSLADARPTVRTKQRATLLSAASVGWGRLELGVTATDPNTLPETPAQELEVHDLVALAVIGTDELDDTPDTARAAVVDAVGSAILDAEDLAFAVGAAADRPKGIVNAANVARVPAGNKVAVSVSNTPTWAQLSSIPFLLGDRFRDNGTWVMHPTSAGKVAALPEATNFEPGPNGRGLMGWPVRLLSALPDPATAGTGDASILFGDFRSAYRIADRQGITVTRLVQRYAVEGKVGFIIKVRCGADLVRPTAVALYTQ
jgi:HK97 family phage major capsid protein